MMTQRKFREQRQPAWDRFAKLINKIDTNGLAKLTGPEAWVFSKLFREVCSDLAISRSRDWGAGLVGYLNELVVRGHNNFYKAQPGRISRIFTFLAVEFPRTLRRNLGYFLAAAALFFIPLIATWAVVQSDPTLATHIMSAAQLQMAEEMYSEEMYQETTVAGFGSERAAMGGFYIFNNVGIAFRCFAWGILFGTGTVYLLISNGIVLGAFFGYVVSKGHGENLLSFAVSHGSFELTAIAVAGGAGLMLADAMVHPGQRSRVESLRARGSEAVQIAMGAGAMLVLAAALEAFWSPAPIPALWKYCVGGFLWLLVVLYLALAGRGGKRT